MKENDLAVTVQLEMGSTPAPGVATRRPRRVAGTRGAPLNGEPARAAPKVAGEGASRSARGGRDPLLQNSYGLAVHLPARGEMEQAFTSKDATYDGSFDSAFREAFSKVFGAAPGRSRRNGDQVVVTLVETPLGPLLAGASDKGISLLEYNDRRTLADNLKAMRRRFGCAIVPGQHPLLAKLRAELNQYFQGSRREFTLPLAPRGTPFQEKVWQELRRIPHGQTIPYGELARRIGQPTAQRAVARANGMNCIAILIPCHRVIGKDGTLTGYGGGLWRKRLLLELEQKGRLPGHEGSG